METEKEYVVEEKIVGHGKQIAISYLEKYRTMMKKQKK
jgi:hypothetical protein